MFAALIQAGLVAWCAVMLIYGVCMLGAMVVWLGLTALTLIRELL